VLSAAFLSSCALEREIPNRTFLPGIEQSPMAPSLPRKGENNILTELDETSLQLSACDWQRMLAEAPKNNGLFRMLGAIEGDPTPATTAKGNIDIAASPLFSYALLSLPVPNKREFLSLVDQEIEKNDGPQVILRLAKWLMDLGFVNPLKQRNKIIQETINKLLPGVFAPDHEVLPIRDTIPWMIFKNVYPDLEKSAPLEVLRNYAETLPLNMDGGWQGVEEGFRRGLQTAINGLKSPDPSERACSTMIFHQAVGQLLTIAGYDRLPLETRVDGSGSYLPAFAKLLSDSGSTTFVVCPAPGSFAMDGVRRIMGREALTAFDSTKMVYDLTAQPAPPRICTQGIAVPAFSDRYATYPPELGGEQATGTNVLSLISAVSHFLMTFNPAAVWWMDVESGYPMASFDSFEKISGSGAILPSETYALSLGLLSVSFGMLQSKHLVFLNDVGQEVANAADATKIRLSEYSRSTGDSLPFVTTVRGATLLAELAFKMSESLSDLSTWKKRNDQILKQEKEAIDRELDENKRLVMQMHYLRTIRELQTYIDGTFGSADILQTLVTEDPAGMRAQLTTLKLASSMLMATFATRESADAPTFTCYDHLLIDPIAGTEHGDGTCTARDQKLWKHVMKLISRAYRSPVFAEYSE